MQRYFFLTILTLVGLTTLKSQTSFSCIYRQYCYWNEGSKGYENCKGFDENSVFIVSKDEKTFTHEIESMKSNYSITEKTYDKATETWTYQVTSNEGHKYVYTFDPPNKEIRFVPKKDEKTVMQLFSIKAIY